MGWTVVRLNLTMRQLRSLKLLFHGLEKRSNLNLERFSCLALEIKFMQQALGAPMPVPRCLKASSVPTVALFGMYRFH